MEDTIDVRVILMLLKKRIVWIIASILAGALIMFCVSEFVMQEKYISTISIYVNNNAAIYSDRLSSGDLSASREMAQTYMYILGSTRAKEALREKVDQIEGIDREQANAAAITMSVVSSTEIVKVSVKSSAPELSATICNVMGDVAVELIGEILESGSVKILGDAVIDYKPSEPNTQMNMILGGGVGAVISLIVVFMIFFFDNRVKDEADFVQKVKIPVLGEVPNVEESVSGKGYGRYYAYYSEEK